MPLLAVFTPSLHDGRHPSPAAEQDVTHYRLRWGASSPPSEHEAVHAAAGLTLEGDFYRVPLPGARRGDYVSVEARDAAGLYSEEPLLLRTPTLPAGAPPPPVTGAAGDADYALDLRPFVTGSSDLTFELASPSSAATLAPDGYTLVVSRAAARSETVLVRAADPWGAHAYLAVTITVTAAPAGAPAPIVDLRVETYP